MNQIFLDFLQDNALSQLVNCPTRGSNILDIFITDRPSLVESCNTIDGNSDHETVLVTSSVLVPCCHPVKRSIYLWSHADFDHIKQKIQFLCEEFIVTHLPSTPGDVLWNKFLSICNAGLNKVPTKLTSSRLI